MDFISNQEQQLCQMLKVIGVEKIEELFTAIPELLRFQKPLVDDGLSEYEGMMLMEELSKKNTYSQFDNYLGAGAYEHHVPALVQSICSKSEFLTSYTPYQAEASQGMLQIIFEFQSAICALTGLDVANASVYDGASACAEAALMAIRHYPERSKILIAESVHPHYKQVVQQYLASHSITIESILFHEEGQIDLETLEKQIGPDTAAVLVQNPNFFGGIENVKEVSKMAGKYEALTILCANPLVYGIFASASELGVDIAVGDCQPLGIPLQFGGPYAGYIACRSNFLRQLPGRIVGETKDSQGQRGFVLTLQAREQHIRREKATSNICTNQALAALASLITILWYGRYGIQKLALTNFQRAAYLKSKMLAMPGLRVKDTLGFNEFIVGFSQSIDKVLNHFRSHGIEPGLDLGRYYPQFKNHLLVAVTETKSKKQLDRYLQTLLLIY